MTDQNVPHVVLFKYNWFHMGHEQAVVGPFESAGEAKERIAPLLAEGLTDFCETLIVPFSSLATVTAALKKRKVEAAAEEAEELARRGEQHTIDDVIKRCEGLPDLPVVISSVTQYDGMSPGKMGSYRGAYDELAIKPTSGEPAILLSTFKGEMERSIGSYYRGYKGGDHYMSGDTQVWVSEYGVSSGLAVVDVRLSDDGQRILLVCVQK